MRQETIPDKTPTQPGMLRRVAVILLMFASLLTLAPAAQATGDNELDPHGFTNGYASTSQGSCSASNYISVPSANPSDKMAWPISASANSQVGCRLHPIHKDYRPHNGRDMAAGAGTEIVAAYGGKVTSLSSSCDGITEITHASGYKTRYIHMTYEVSWGQVVQKGERIGKVAVNLNKRCSTGPHLHFEILRYGSVIDWDNNIPRGTWVNQGSDIPVNFGHLTPPTCKGQKATLVAVPGVWLNGTEGNDVIVGTSSNDFINGKGGNDLICSGAGNDLVLGGSGEDRIYGQGGNDNLQGEGNDDLLYGGSGADVVKGGAGEDQVYGNGGNDRVYGGSEDDVLFGGKGGDDKCYGGSHNDWTSPTGGCEYKQSVTVFNLPTVSTDDGSGNGSITDTPGVNTGSNNTGTTSGWQAVSVQGSNNGDGFILFGNGTRTWVSQACRQQLQNAGITMTPVSWNTIQPNTQVSNAPNCNTIQNTLGSSTTGTGGTGGNTGTTSGWQAVSVQGSNNGDGFILFGNGTRTWVSQACRQQLQNAGITMTPVSWNTIQPNTQVSNAPNCNTIQNTLGSSTTGTGGTGGNTGTTSSLELVAINGYSDAWILSSAGTRQWIDQSCRTQLVNAGKSLRTADWNSEVGPRPDVGTRLSCNQIQNQL